MQGVKMGKHLKTRLDYEMIYSLAKEVKRIETYYQKYDGGSLEYDSPLFRERSLFVDPK